jgi:hypothetical protein
MFVHLSPILEKKQGSKGQQPLGGVWGVPTFPFFFSVRGRWELSKSPDLLIGY